MTEQEAEKRIGMLLRKYCFTTRISYNILYGFLFKFGGMYKINNILNQVEQDED